MLFTGLVQHSPTCFPQLSSTVYSSELLLWQNSTSEVYYNK